MLHRHSPNRVIRHLRAWAVCAVSVALGGCYDAEALIDARRESAVSARLEEVDLGNFRITLPQPSATTETAEIHFRAFGRVSHDDVGAVRNLLKHHRPNLEHRILLAIRSLEKEEFADPELKSLRRVLAGAVNQPLADSPVKSVGFNTFGFSNYH